LLAPTARLVDYSEYTSARLLDAFEQAPDRVRTVIAGLSEEELRSRARGAKAWSCQEIVLHLADSEILGAFRMRKVWSEPGAPLPGYNENIWTARLDHQHASREEREAALLVFSALRRSIVPILRRATEADLNERTGNHPEFGRMTLRNLLELYADHGERHLEQILLMRRLLEKPLEFPLLLPRRLY